MPDDRHWHWSRDTYGAGLLLLVGAATLVLGLVVALVWWITR
jgi:hypothetical protein